MPQVTVSEKQMPMVGMFVAAAILVIAIVQHPTVDGDNVFYNYALSVAIVAMIFSLFGLILNRNDGLNERFGKFNAYFLFLWNVIGATILTFPGPFQQLGNAYFSVWALAVFSMMAVGVSPSSLKDEVSGMGAQAGLMASAIIVLIALVGPAGLGSNNANGQVVYGVVLAALTIVFIGAFMFLERGGSPPSRVKMPLLVLLAINWVVCACFLTFNGPFTAAGNGYFGAWGGAATGLSAAAAAYGA